MPPCRSSIFLEAGNKYVHSALQHHTSNGGGHGGAENPNNWSIRQAYKYLSLLLSPSLHSRFMREQHDSYSCTRCGACPKAGHKCSDPGS